MRILFLTDNFPPETNAPASRTWEHARLWVKEGNDVTVITSAPNFPRGELFDGYRNRLRQVETIDGIRVVRVWTYIAPNAGFLKRSLDFFSFMFSALPAALLEKRPDIIIGTSPQFFTVVAAWLVSVLKRRPWIFELRDLWPESIKAVGALKDGILLRALEGLEYFLYRRAAAIVSVTESFRDILAARGVDAAKIHVVRNGVDTNLFSPDVLPGGMREELGLSEGDFLASYIGTHGMAHGLDLVLEAAARTNDLPVHYLLVGEGADKARLEREARRRALGKVHFLGGQPKSRMPALLAASDACLVLLKREPLFRTVIPSKIFEAMAMGRPIILGVEGESARLLDDAGAGICIQPENATELVAAIEHLRQTPSQARQLGESGLSAARKK